MQDESARSEALRRISTCGKPNLGCLVPNKALQSPGQTLLYILNVEHK